MVNFEIDRIIANALNEDIGCGDITTEYCVPESAYTRGRLIAKEEGVICGLLVFTRVFEILDESVKVTPRVKEGEYIADRTVIAEVEGPARSILAGERTALNLLQRMSGIATNTYRAVKAVEGTKARITETRKTTPGLRILEKYAVRVGGGINHRIGLSDGVLVKDNHIVAAGGVMKAVDMIRKHLPHTLKIEVEVTDFDQLDEAVQAGADIILLDNMTDAQMREAVLRINGRALSEASGNMGNRDLRKVAATGVDIISIGALTHTARAMDISLKFI